MIIQQIKYYQKLMKTDIHFYYVVIYLTSQARESTAQCIHYYDHETVIQPCHNNSLNSTHTLSLPS